ncbi:MAG: sugar ABC transporter permease [Flaviflexus sp.]|nr:sugar ABC transporter permease [Flaviflexus sp.]
MSPTVIITVAVIVIPVLWNVILAFQDKSFVSIRTEGIFGGEFSLANFTSAISARGFWQSLWTTVSYAVLSTAGSIIVGLIAALALRGAFRGRGFVRSLMLLPYVAPVVAVAFVWQVMLHPQYGILNHYLPGGAISFFSVRPWAFISVIVFEIWRYFPFAFLFLSARLVALPRDIEEAALVDGVTPWQNFRYVVLPQLMPTISLLAVLRLIMTFNKFDDVYLLTGGAAGTEVAAVRVYNRLMGSSDISGAAATALILAVVLAGMLVAYASLTKRVER